MNRLGKRGDRSGRWRPWLAPALFAAAAVSSLAWYRLMHIAVRPTAVASGIALFIVILALALFNLRKKLPFLLLFPAASWTKFHLYAGWFGVALFLIHVQFRIPQGHLEVLLAGAFAAVVTSGIVGLFLSRNLPPRLTRHGEEILFERIPALRRQLQQSTGKLALDSIAETGSSTLADYYASNLKTYFSRSRDFWWHLLGSSRPLHNRLARLGGLDRYLSEKERKVASSMSMAIRAKDNLDFHGVCQGLLKGWLFVHIPLTYCLILLAIVHGLLAWSFINPLR